MMNAPRRFSRVSRGILMLVTSALFLMSQLIPGDGEGAFAINTRVRVSEMQEEFSGVHPS